MSTPILETERLRLRSHQIQDFDACAAMWADPIVTKHIGGTPFLASQSWQKILIYVGHWSLMGFGYWAVEEKSTGRYIGEVGFADFKRELKPSISGIPELGWALISSVHGKGYATEALRAAVAWGDTHFAPGRTVCIINPENTASLRVADKIGYRECLRTTYKDSPCVVLDRHEQIQ
jgi:RimJ/RimL family protein N-acetyltransferase